MSMAKYIYLYRNLDPSLKKPWRLLSSFPGDRSRKNVWCSTAHFHKCLQLRSFGSLLGEIEKDVGEVRKLIN